MPSAFASSSPSVPSVFTYETAATPQFLDPHVSWYQYDAEIMQNTYETLMGYTPGSSTTVVPWLARSFSVSSNGLSAKVQLRSGVDFADGNPLNSYAVYFSLNRLLIMDGSTTYTHGTQASWILQQLLNQSLSSFYNYPQTYDAHWVSEVLAENFVQVRGTLALTLHILHPTASLRYLLAGEWAAIVDPLYVMPRDVSLWNSQSYTLPYPVLSGAETQMITQYFYDEAATCNTGPTPDGCGATYLETSGSGSLAGTGPYVLQSFNSGTYDLVLTANQNYWGGPLASKIEPSIQTIDMNYVPDEAQRVSDLKAAAASGSAMYIDVQTPSDVIKQNAWLNHNRFVSSIGGVSLYGPFDANYITNFDPFATNVTNPNTGTYYTFQPLADVRWRTAFADAVDLAQINRQYYDNLNQVALNVVPPGMPPSGAYNPAITPDYAYNLNFVKGNISAACASPLTKFTDVDGNPLPPGTIDNSCADASAAGATVTLVSATGAVASGAIMSQIASNVQSALNGLGYGGITVTAMQESAGVMYTQASQHHLYFYGSTGWVADYPWVLDFMAPMYVPGNTFTGWDGWNLAAMQTLESQALSADAAGNVPSLISATNAMNGLANKQVMYLWTFYPQSFWTITSNVKGVFLNPSYPGLYFAKLT